jgi:DNA-binding CsgD family transcriptional regulator/tetratricopeptide (TPR) repeat protein
MWAAATRHARLDNRRGTGPVKETRPVCPSPRTPGHNGGVAERLLERDAELRALTAAVDDAGTGRSGAVLVLGEAGIGTTSLVREFLRRLGGRARLLVGACDDLVTPRTFGPLRDAVALTGGALADALTGEPDRERVYQALLADLSRPGPSTVLVVEDVHWADDATLDALRYIARRIDQLTAVLVLTYRDDELDPEHPLRRLLGAFGGGRVRRLVLPRLTRAAVAELGAAEGIDGAALYEVTAGNPFFVTEALGAPAEDVPATVVDAVMARLRQLPAPTRDALEQLAVVPSRVENWLADALLRELGPLVAAERRGIIEMHPEGLAFRHELARQALERSLPAVRRIELNRAVVDALLARDDADLSRVVHHAVLAGDVATVLARATAAAREAAHAGSHRQALAHYQHVVAYLDALPDDARARILSEYAWQLYAAQRWGEAVDVARRAVGLWERLGDAPALSEALLVLSRGAYMADRVAEAVAAVERAEAVVAGTGDDAALAQALSYRGAVLALTDQQEAALDLLVRACDLAERVDRTDLLAHSLNYLGCARVDLGDAAGIDTLRVSLDRAMSISHYEYAARAYTNLGEKLYRLRDYDALERCIADGLPYCTEHDLPGHAFNLQAHRAMTLAARGAWAEAELLLRTLFDTIPDPGHLARLTMPSLGRLLARRGQSEADDLTDRAWQMARRSDTLSALAPAGLARIEWAWLDGDISRAAEQITVLSERTESAAAARTRGELLRYLSRAGLTAGPFPICPAEWALGLKDDWRAAADAWLRIGEPYEAALELAMSGEVEPTLEALDVLDRLGAAPAARLVRRRLRGLGVAHVPRGRQHATRANPSGLAERQLDVLKLLADGLTNAEIAERLVLSIRTVDHHVSAILAKVGATSRRDAARIAAKMHGRA